MFGYVNLYKNNLDEKTLDLFKSYYCGLCKELGKSFNQVTRLGLSYDFTFLAICLDSLSNDNVEQKELSCLKHIGKKKDIIINNEFIKYAAQMSVALNYYKLTDDVNDDNLLKAKILRLLYKSQMKQIDLNFEIVLSDIEKHLQKLNKLENEKCKEIDEISHQFALIMQSIFSYNISLNKFGYNLGKFIYILDAFDDLDEDLKCNKYNTILLKYNYDGTSNMKIKIAKEIDFLLTYILSEISKEYEKNEIYKNKELLDNIIYLGLRQKKDIILHKGEKNNE